MYPWMNGMLWAVCGIWLSKVIIIGQFVPNAEWSLHYHSVEISVEDT